MNIVAQDEVIIQPVATKTRGRSAAFKRLVKFSLLLCVFSVAGALILGDQRIFSFGFPLSLIPAVIAMGVHVYTPKRILALLDVRGDDLFITSRAHPAKELGRLYRESIRIPIGEIREIETGLVYMSRLGLWTFATLRKSDGSADRVYFAEKLEEDVYDFFRQLHEKWPQVEVVESGAHNWKWNED